MWPGVRHRAEPHYTDWARLIVVAVLYGLAFLTGLRRKTAAGGPFSVR